MTFLCTRRLYCICSRGSHTRRDGAGRRYGNAIGLIARAYNMGSEPIDRNAGIIDTTVSQATLQRGHVRCKERPRVSLVLATADLVAITERVWPKDTCVEAGSVGATEIRGANCTW